MISRRDFLKRSVLSAAAAALSPLVPLSGCRKRTEISSRFSNKVIVLGMDGLDPALVRRFVAEGRMPTFAKMMEKGHFGPLATTMPPQSPVAWASFITGTNPGGHGIYDFIHRDPKTFTPHLSTSRSYDAPAALPLGSWALPLGSGSVELRRLGTPFWSLLEEKGIPAVVHQIPANFPIVPSGLKSISGMGTPDLLGSYGTFTLFTDSFVPDAENIAGGRVVQLRILQHQARAALSGPKNPFRSGDADAAIELQFLRDPSDPVLTIKAQGRTLVLKQGEWSGWVPLSFDYIPHLMSSSGMVRFYVKEVHPRLKVYCSPINIDPLDPAMPIESSGYAREVAENIGRFYTQGFPADTKALSSGTLSDDEYLAQANIVLDESMRALDYGLSRFDEGFYFFYFSSTDQSAHMLIRTMDPSHPQYNPNASEAVKNAIPDLYSQMDEALRRTLAKVDSRTLLLVISDHGFAPFTREFHINNWLVEQGLMVLTQPKKMREMRFFDYVDWERTKAYALGINAVYVNRRGRERNGAIGDAEAQAVKAELLKRLPAVRDPQTGTPVVNAAYDSQQLYSGPFVDLAPDVIVGYSRGYRSSDEAAFGKFKDSIVGNRTDKWASDHCMDASTVPGTLLMNRACVNPQPGLWDMGATILRAFGQEPAGPMSKASLIEA